MNEERLCICDHCLVEFPEREELIAPNPDRDDWTIRGVDADRIWIREVRPTNQDHWTLTLNTNYDFNTIDTTNILINVDTNAAGNDV